MKRCQLLKPGLVEYGKAWDLQKELFNERTHDRIPDTLIVLQHPPTYTIGRRTVMDQPLFDDDCSNDIALYRVDRGGGATYHGPGQVVAYPILNLRSYTEDYYTYLRLLEEVVIHTLSEFDINACRIKGLTGVWSGRKKICSIGVRIIKGTTMHGLSLNVNNDLEPFSRIVPCNLHGIEMTSMSEISGSLCRVQEVEASLIKHFARVFNLGIMHVRVSME